MKHEHTVTVALTEEQEARLLALTVRLNRVAANGGEVVNVDKLLRMLILNGSMAQIEERMNGISAALTAMEAAQEGVGETCNI